MNSKGAAINIDSDFLWYMRESCPDGLNNLKEKLDIYLDGYVGHGISDVNLCVFCQCSVFPSRVMTWFGDKMDQTSESGIPVDYSEDSRLIPYREGYSVPGLDPVEYIFEGIRKRGMHPWASVRMNDCHQSDAETSFLRGDLFYEARNAGFMIGEGIAGAYYSTCLDYSGALVRDRMYDYIVELLDRYDIDGLELDFMREIFCFNYEKTPDCDKIMTEFLTRVRTYTNLKAKERGHEIRVSLRLCESIGSNLTFGFNVSEIIKKGLADVLIPTSRFAVTGSDTPIDKWKALTEGTRVEVWPGIEYFLTRPVINTEENARGFAAQYLDLGADKIYIFNQFRECVHYEGDGWEERIPTSPVPEYTDIHRRHDALISAIWRAAYSSDSAHGGKRRHVAVNGEPRLSPKGTRPYMPLPIKVDGHATARKITGLANAGRVLLYLGVIPGNEPPRVEVDGTPATLLGITDDSCFARSGISRAELSRLGSNNYSAYSGIDPKDIASLGVSDYYAYEVTSPDLPTRTLSFYGNTTVNYLEFVIEH